MATPPKQQVLRPSKAPNLPVAPVEYDQRYQDQFNNALRLYFAEVDNFTQALGTNSATSSLSAPYGSFHYDRSTTLTSGITNVSTTPIPVTSTAGYPSSGAILIGTEIITYTAITATTFAGTITRGAYSTSTSAHSAGDAITSVQGTTAATVTPMYLNTTDFSNGVVLQGPDNTSKVAFSYSGLYNLQFSAQFVNYASGFNGSDNVTIWIRQNGADVAASAGIVTVPGSHGGVAGAIIAGWNFFVSVPTITFNNASPPVSNQYIELYWTTDSGNSVIQTYPSGTTPVHPVSPALILTAQFVSAL